MIKLSDYDYNLPKELIAKYPVPDTSAFSIKYHKSAGIPRLYRIFCDKLFWKIVIVV